jgi:hypothetical protein
MWGSMITEGARVISDIVGTIEKVLDNLVGSRNVDLINVINL